MISTRCARCCALPAGQVAPEAGRGRTLPVALLSPADHRPSVCSIASSNARLTYIVRDRLRPWFRRLRLRFRQRNDPPGDDVRSSRKNGLFPGGHSTASSSNLRASIARPRHRPWYRRRRRSSSTTSFAVTFLTCDERASTEQLASTLMRLAAGVCDAYVSPRDGCSSGFVARPKVVPGLQACLDEPTK